jgi:hypothetical protein
MDFNFDGTVYNETEWGSVTITFTGQDPMMYFNLAINGSWQVQNIPVLSGRGISTLQTMTYYFNLRTPRGTHANSVNYDYAFSSNILTSMPSGSTAAPVGDGYIELWSGIQGSLMPDLGKAAPLVGGQVNSNQKHAHKDFPNQECQERECVPAAISNSLQFLNQKYDLGMKTDKISIDEMKKVVDWNNGASADWGDKKKQYMDNHQKDYPITTRIIKDIDALIKEIDDGQDIELRENWTDKNGKEAGHATCLIGITKLNDGNYSLDVVDDQDQGHGGGCDKPRTYIYNPTTRTFNESGFISKFQYAVVECPKPVMSLPTIDIYTPIGDTYKAPMKINSTQNVSSWKAGFRFDPHILECVNFTEGPYLSDVGTTTWTPGMIDNINGIVTSHNCTLEAGKSQNGTGVLAYITFRVKNYGKTAINLTDEDSDPCECMVLDPDGNEISLAFIDGEITLKETPPPGVGGVSFPINVVPIDKFGLLAPYFGLASTIVVATVATAIYVKRVKRRKEKQ